MFHGVIIPSLFQWTVLTNTFLSERFRPPAFLIYHVGIGLQSKHVIPDGGDLQLYYVAGRSLTRHFTATDAVKQTDDGEFTADKIALGNTRATYAHLTSDQQGPDGTTSGSIF